MYSGIKKLALTQLEEQMNFKLSLNGMFLIIPPYIPDLTPSDLGWLVSQWFTNNEDLQNALTGWLHSQAADFYAEHISTTV